MKRIAEGESPRRADDASSLERIDEMNRRHLAGLRFIKEKALEAIRAMPREEVLAAARKVDAQRSRRRR